MRDRILKTFKARGISQRGFCKRTGVSTVELNEFFKGKRLLSMKMAFGLEFLYIKTADYWLTVQVKEQCIKYRKEQF